MTRGLTLLRLRIALGLLFLALALPTAILVWQAQRQIRFEAFHQHRLLAEELGQRIDAQLQKLIDVEESRGYADYRFLVVAGGNVNALQRSPLAQYPLPAGIPGLAGYFQVDARGQFSTPLLPESPAELANLAPQELPPRIELHGRLLDVLQRNQLAAAPADRPLLGASAAGRDSYSSSAASSDAPAAQAAFDELEVLGKAKEQRQNTLGRVDELGLDDKDYRLTEQRRKQDLDYGQQLQKKSRSARVEQGSLLESALGGRVRLFESEVAPFELALLDGGYLVVFRNAWRDGQRTVQGALLDQRAFLQGAFEEPFRSSSLAAMSDLIVVYQGGVLGKLPGQAERGGAGDLQGSLLHRVRLSAPLSDFQLLWTVNRLPAGPGARVIGWSSVVIFAVLLLGFLGLERLGRRQIALARQQQDFVSAVSHELKTPLTSIRMYGEMLREGWVGEDKRKEYYAFIHDEAERLSRLIGNVLQLARLERRELGLSPRRVSVQTLMDLMRSKTAAQVQRAGFTCTYEVDPQCAAMELDLDPDAFTQVVINLVDNALKFAAGGERKQVDLAVRPAGPRHVVWSVRDYGPGVPRDQMRRIFQLFYRVGSELTRETAGTGIGLALARQLARAMGGEVDVINVQPGAQFEVRLPVS